MSTNHTPAPWKAHKTPNDPDFTHEISGVATIYMNENSEANARLIAAAPELLEAAMMIERAIKNNELFTRQEHEKLKAAIAKATGEQA